MNWKPLPWFVLPGLAASLLKAEPALRLGTATAAPGATAEMSLHLDSPPNPSSGCQVTVWLPERITLIRVNRGAQATDPGQVFIAQPVSGLPGEGVRLVVYAADHSWGESSELARLVLASPMDREPGDYPVRMDVADVSGTIRRNHALSNADGTGSAAHTVQDGILRLRLAPTVDDSNGNGIPDAWEIAHFGAVADIHHTTDSDADGLSDYYEYQAGTNPRDPASCLRIGSISRAGPTPALRLEWICVPNRAYVVYRGLNLAESRVDAALSGPIPAVAPVMGFTSPPFDDQPRAFYHVRMLP